MIYSTSASAQGGRNGTTALDDGSFSVQLAMAGTGQPGQNPEQLFALGYAACFDQAAKLTAQRLKLPLTGSTTQATVALVKDGDSFKLAVTISFTAEGLTADQARELGEAAHAVCPYSNALRGNADVSLVVNA